MKSTLAIWAAGVAAAACGCDLGAVWAADGIAAAGVAAAGFGVAACVCWLVAGVRVCAGGKEVAK